MILSGQDNYPDFAFPPGGCRVELIEGLDGYQAAIDKQRQIMFRRRFFQVAATLAILCIISAVPGWARGPGGGGGGGSHYSGGGGAAL